MQFLKRLIILLLLPLGTLLQAAPVLAQTAEELGIGTIEVPAGTENYQVASGEEIGIIFFLTVMIRVFSIAVGVYAAYNFALAAFNFFNFSGDSGAMEKAKNQFLQSIIGLILIVLTYTLTGLVGLIFFGDAQFILSPTL